MDNTDIDDISNDNLRRIADAIEEILRIVKKDMEPKKK